MSRTQRGESEVRVVAASERGSRLIEAGWMAGWVSGFGMSGFWWMNPYIALSLLLGGMTLAVVARVAAR